MFTISLMIGWLGVCVLWAADRIVMAIEAAAQPKDPQP